MTQPLEEPTEFPPDNEHEMLWLVWAVAAAFGCYFCMYGFRKPFTSGSFADTTLWGFKYKIILVTSQVLGYTISKFAGIKIIAEMAPERRAISILKLIAIAEVALILFGVVPRPWNAVCLFLNGLPLGMVFGLVLGFLEGRRVTEALTAGLCTSFILADGATKSTGAWLLAQGISEEWMPSVAGGIFLLPLIVCVAMLARIPPPTRKDMVARNERLPMNRSDRTSFVRRYVWGLIPLVLIYLLVSIVRGIRADFAPEIWKDLGSEAVPSIFTYSEIWVALGVLAVNGGAVLIVDNRRAFFTSLATCGLGLGLLTVAILALRYEQISGFVFMVLVGLGLYLPYVAMHTTVFERILGMTPERGNLGFLMYVADSIGYLGYVGVMLTRNFSSPTEGVLGLLTMTCWVTIGLSAIFLLQSGYYFMYLPRLCQKHSLAEK